jgi:hypothetical protein
MSTPPVAGADTEMCPAGQNVGPNIFSDDIESGSSKWSFTHSLGTYNWAIAQYYAHAGVASLYGYNPSSASDLNAILANSVNITPNSYLFFNHAYQFESSSSGSVNYDGGVLEYSTNNGSSWTSQTPVVYTYGWNQQRGYPQFLYF